VLIMTNPAGVSTHPLSTVDAGGHIWVIEPVNALIYVNFAQGCRSGGNLDPGGRCSLNAGGAVAANSRPAGSSGGRGKI